MNFESLLLEAPLLAAVVLIVSLFIRYLGKRDEELRHIINLFNERVASLESTSRESTKESAVLRETVHNLDITLREMKETISGKLKGN
tara:strand:- start:420 stop:683 length:264 start_codon:yes stop_codon:yes gene_type:complete